MLGAAGSICSLETAMMLCLGNSLEEARLETGILVMHPEESRLGREGELVEE